MTLPGRLFGEWAQELEHDKTHKLLSRSSTRRNTSRQQNGLTANWEVPRELGRNVELPRYPGVDALRTAMQNPKFTQPVTVRASAQGAETIITDVYECSSFLLRKWPGKRGPSHRAALQACHDASADKKPISSVRRAFALAAREAGILVGQ
ncbi:MULTISPECIES: DUF982 domain-containing protein [unclassified Mesorhizobium]|uniref:DUF982 domain-containing protein n=1 Tax=unclassified Mesorhizobium TaxID=325217 RepID=UPI001FE13D90|nr:MULTISPECIES: DUF982 domain-containing protein [unclassified Mesorhizobium]